MGNQFNNPRMPFEETVALDAWRSKFDETKRTSDLSFDVVFGTGRFGGGDEPIGFRFGLKQAEVAIRGDLGGSLSINKESIARSRNQGAKLTRSREDQRVASIEGNASVSDRGGSIGGKGQAKIESRQTEQIEETLEKGAISVSDRPTSRGHVFILRPIESDRLHERPWAEGSIPRLRFVLSEGVDHSDPPEPTVSVYCRREDMIIDGIYFTEKSGLSFKNIGRNRQVAVEAYIKERILQSGLESGDLADKFAISFLADAIPEVQ